ncbi:MAG: transcription termination factor Rho [Deltaproteobacteria bacterium]|nr:transcription termination factor Rho [Deltaproteobacteria bacterium]
MADKETKEKPLDKMTVKGLKEIAKEMPEITGVHGMNKAELLDAIEKVKGIAETPKEKAETPKEKAETPKEKAETPKKKVETLKEKKAESVKDMKNKIRAFKAKRKVALEAKDKKMATIYRRRISRLKKQTRRAA